jgi:hypothetical protein
MSQAAINFSNFQHAPRATTTAGGNETMGKAIAPTEKRTDRLLRARRALAKVEKEAKAATPAGGRMDASWQIAIEQAKRELFNRELHDKYGHKRGTPETYAKIEALPANRRQSPIDRMYEDGQVTIEQQNAAHEIESVAEAIERGVSVRGASLEARVDNAGAGRDMLIESLGRVRLEVAYTAWRNHLPMPRRMILDMILSNRSLVATARVYGVPWRQARQRLLDALDLWLSLKAATWKAIDAEDVAAIYSKLGCGILLPPKPKQVEA